MGSRSRSCKFNSRGRSHHTLTPSIHPSIHHPQLGAERLSIPAAGTPVRRPGRTFTFSRTPLSRTLPWRASAFRPTSAALAATWWQRRTSTVGRGIGSSCATLLGATAAPLLFTPTAGSIVSPSLFIRAHMCTIEVLTTTTATTNTTLFYRQASLLLRGLLRMLQQLGRLLHPGGMYVLNPPYKIIDPNTYMY
jgi:hypothetical protein